MTDLSQITKSHNNSYISISVTSKKNSIFVIAISEKFNTNVVRDTHMTLLK